MSRLLILLQLALAPAGGVICAACEEGAAGQETGTVSLSLTPRIDAGPISRAVFDLRIDSIGADGLATPFLVLPDLAAGPSGALSFVGTCLSGPNGEDRLAVATATLKSIDLTSGTETFGAQLPITQVQPFLCVRGGDAAVNFVFEVVLQADRGFVDVRVDVERLECAAKLDCMQSFLPGADGRHGPTFVTGLSCRGVGASPLDNLVSLTRELRCYDAEGALLAREAAPLVSVERSFTGFELAPPGQSGLGPAYWNTATLLDEAAFAGAAMCHFEAFAFVRSQPIGGARTAWARVGALAIHWDVELRLDQGVLTCSGGVGPEPLAIRIDEAPVPSDSSVSAQASPVTLSTTAILPGTSDCAGVDAPCVLDDAGATSVLRLWSAREVVFPLQAMGETDRPAQNEQLWVRSDLGTPYDTRFESACAPSRERAWIVVTLSHPTVDPGGHRAALLLVRQASGDWVCDSEPGGSCIEHALSDVACTPETP